MVGATQRARSMAWAHSVALMQDVVTSNHLTLYCMCHGLHHTICTIQFDVHNLISSMNRTTIFEWKVVSLASRTDIQKHVF